MILQESKEILIAHSNYSLPEDHLTYLKRLANSYYPVIIYDIGACVMTWTKAAQKIWPKSKIFLFDATDSVEFLYQENEYQYSIGVLSDVEGKEVVFYQNSTYPHGNSYYKEYSPFTDMYYPISTRRIVKTQTLDNIVQRKNFPTPDLIKIDVQGAEIDILKGMTYTLQNCKHLLI
jgi:FkbM family methyltransferase